MRTAEEWKTYFLKKCEELTDMDLAKGQYEEYLVNFVKEIQTEAYENAVRECDKIALDFDPKFGPVVAAAARDCAIRIRKLITGKK